MTADAAGIHRFDNGIAVYERYLAPQQIERYASLNLHEPEEERVFVDSLDGVSGGVFLDVGAAIGYYSLLALKGVPELEVHAFEPLSAYRRAIGEHLALNGLPPDVVKVSGDAVAGKQGRAMFAASGYSSRLGIRMRDVVRRRSRPARVRTVTLDGVVASANQTVRLVKIDVQGAEVDVLNGATASLAQRLVETWLIGTHSDQLHRDCRDALTRHGYAIEVDEPAPPGQPDGIILARSPQS